MLNRTTSWTTPYTFSGKEKDVETGYGYFGARYYDSGLSIWLSVDPMAEKYPHQTNYVYCSNNPVIIVDPNGEDEYFNEFGKYLGSDNSEKTNKVKIMKQDHWDSVKQTRNDGNKSIDFVSESTGNEISNLASEANLSESAQLNIYKHFNPTDLPIVAERSPKDNGVNSGMITHAENYVPTKISILLKGNLNCNIIDNVDEIVNIFVHEKVHVDDYRAKRINSSNDGDYNHECRAIEKQQSHPSYVNTRDVFKRAIEEYSSKFNCR